MAKSLEERIAERVRKDERGTRRAQRTVFLALKDEIAQAMNAGWSVKDIWRTLHDEDSITVSYQAFNAYVNRYIRAPEAAAPKKTGKPTPTNAPAKTGFTINPSPKKEDLL